MTVHGCHALPCHCQVTEFLAETHREAMRSCGVKVLEGVLEGREGPSCGGALAVLLSLAARSRPVLAAVSSHILQIGKSSCCHRLIELASSCRSG